MLGIDNCKLSIVYFVGVEAKSRNGTGGGTTEQLQIVEEPVMNGQRGYAERK